VALLGRAAVGAMTRIIAGAAGGRRLATVPGRSTRPTTDRVRESLFGTVTSIRGGLTGAAVLDLYAGSGAVGLEALSRGAADVILVEADSRAARVISANIGAVGLAGARLVPEKAQRVLARGPGAAPPRDFVFADPPYAAGDGELAGMLTALADHGWLAAGALVVVERSSRSGPLDWPAGYESERTRRYGEATLWYGLAAGGKLVTTSATGA
jgi:16S rRNA (guanine966-N2)-methyltransferase